MKSIRSSVYQAASCLFLAGPLISCGVQPSQTRESAPSVDHAAAGTSTPSRRDPIIITTDIIGVSLNDIWGVLMDFKNYENMNDWVILEGTPALGEKIKAKTKDGTTKLDLQITSLITEGSRREMCWDDITWFTTYGFDGWRCRIVEELPHSSGVRLTNHFEYTGRFDWILDHLTRHTLIDGMTLENESLKRNIERLF